MLEARRSQTTGTAEYRAEEFLGCLTEERVAPTSPGSRGNPLRDPSGSIEPATFCDRRVFRQLAEPTGASRIDLDRGRRMKFAEDRARMIGRPGVPRA